MGEYLNFLEKIPKEPNGLFIVYELFTFQNFFRLLLKSGFDHEEALRFILSRSSLSAYVFQEWIHNEEYKTLTEEVAIPAEYAFCRAQLIYDLFFAEYSKEEEEEE